MFRYCSPRSPWLKSLLVSLILWLAILSPLAGCTLPPVQTPVAEPAPTTAATSLVELLGEEAYRFAEGLAGIGPRPVGSPGEASSTAWLREQYTKMGLSATIQDFPVNLFSREQPRLRVLSPVEITVEAIPLAQSAAGDVSGEIADAGLGRKEDLPREGLTGQLALIQRGELTFTQKVANVAEAGATGAIIYNNTPGPFGGTLASPGAIPAVSISQENGLMLKAHLAQNRVRARVWVQLQQYTGHNVMAEIPGRSPGMVVIGAHYDSVAVSPGANDNASGVAALLTVAGQLLKQRPALSVRLIAFGAEEEGLLGSDYYVRRLSEEDRQRIVDMINLDVVGADVPLAALGDAQLAAQARTLARELNIAMGDFAGEAPSDHLSFLRVRIPAVIITTPDFSRIHTPRDTLDALSRPRLGEASLLALKLVNQLAQR